MKIKKLELSGFKSFVDRTILHFDHDVLGIVGPNGCGKSNIVDAIRWCMGEQSARHLRGRSMEDVIFSGSESRAAHDMAEVTLTFDNDRPEEVPLEYKEYAEIAVTRRLHRSGDSEYLVNKTPVRLRDVTDLFLGTGAGTKAYAIVEQGKVGLIVSAKPEERRLLVEEAAGITKFKSRKKQAEKKMELTQQNLLRVGDIVAEIERNLASLKRQAAKAERYVAYRGELEDLQLHEASHRYLELVGWCRYEGGEVEQRSREVDEARAELDAREAEVEASRLEVHDAEERVEKAQNASFGAENAVRAEEAAIERAKDRIRALESREREAEGERAEMTQHGARLAVERDAVSAETATFEGQERDQGSRLAEEEARQSELASVHAAADAKAAEIRQVISRGRADIAGAAAKLGGFERRLAEMTSRVERLAVERESCETTRVDTSAKADEWRASVERLRGERVASADRKVTLERELGTLKVQLQTCERRLEEAKAELSRRRSRHTALEEMHARLEGAGAGTRALVGKKDACILGMVGDRVEAPAELTQALAGLLGARLEDVVVKDVERGVQLLEELARDRRGRAAILPRHPAYVAGAGVDPTFEAEDGVVGRLIEALRFATEDEPLVRSMIGETLVVRDLAAARRLRERGARAPLVTVDGWVLQPDGRIAGGQGDAVAAGRLDSKREARELGEMLLTLDANVTARHDELQRARAELARIGADLDRARNEAHAQELALVTAEKDLQKAEERLRHVTGRLEAIVREQAELARVIAEAGAEREQAAQSLASATAGVEAAEAQLREAEAAVAAARERLEGQRSAVTACKVSLARVREQLAAGRGAAARLARSATELEERSRRLDEELAVNARGKAETLASLGEHQEKLQAALDQAREAQEELATVRGQFERMRAGLLEREGVVKSLRGRFERIREELRTHELSLREKELALEHLLGGIADKFRGLHLPRVVGDHHLRPMPDEVSRARIAELARLIERMGSVNLDAMREHDESQRRFDFYTTQKADLEKALSDLTRAIQQMNRESRRLFEETFTAVNARFREIFPRMFRGGRAELRLTNPEDLLETGIDIVAQPPGKKLSSIELMSGGEKALTAVSLIFAIFQIKPSPFCILDEVDAPLDEANVARYNEMIRSMTDRSQFILVTHIKRTMQLVDVLYGVTMAEPGISKIVSVKVSDAQRERSAPPTSHAAVA